ncbi:MAG: tyrosine-protein phosphatase [Tannerella sp.]|jgi:protein tyrosine/serine phosphatase|nr:tyrosine-protein phosphatase [Tannerella sp.]
MTNSIYKMMTVKKVIIFLSIILSVFLLSIYLAKGTEKQVQSASCTYLVETVSQPAGNNFHKVSDSLYRSAQPEKENLRAYEAFGICTIINLRGIHSDRKKVFETNLKLIEIPMHTWIAANDANIIRALQAIRDAKKPVLVHCMHGADRTGLIIAMYRIVEQGWTKQEALTEMRDGGFGYHSIWKNIPAYIEQVDVEAIRKALH